MPQPHTVTRTVTDAPAATILALLTDFHEWTRWSPWEDIDPDMQRSDDVVEQAPERTTVTWTMHGELNLFMRLFGIFTSMDSMDSMVGPDFEKGLRQLTAAAEAR